MTSMGMLYVVEMDLGAAHIPQFIDWYAGLHTPHLYAAGFRSCISYRSIGEGPSIVDFYQAEDESIFQSAPYKAYRKIAVADPHRPAPVNASPTMFTVYRSRGFDGAREKPESDLLDSDWLSVVRFEADEELGRRFEDWLSGYAESLHARGALRVRLAERSGDSPAGTSKRPRYALIIEWPTRPPRDVEDGTFLPDWLSLEASALFVGFRLYPWPLSADLLRLRDKPDVGNDSLPARGA